MRTPLTQKFLLVVLLLPLLLSCDKNPDTTPVKTLFNVKSITTTGSSWTSREDFTYNNKGQLEAIHWKRQTPYETIGSEEYYYDQAGQLSHIVKKISGLADEELQFTYLQNQVIATSSFVNGKKIAYQLYEYDAEGRLDLVAFYSYNSTANGFDRNGEHRYAYFSDGNVKEIQKFDFSAENATLTWNSTKAYTAYLEASNPRSLDSDVPGILIQRNLPIGYELRYPSSTYPYHFTYHFNADGYLSKRETTYNDGTMEVAVYTYE